MVPGIRGEPGTVVANLDHRLSVLRADCDLDRGRWRCVDDGVAGEICENLTELFAISEHLDRAAAMDDDLTVWRRCARVLCGVLGELGQIDLNRRRLR